MNKRNYTLIELLTVIFIIGVLAGLIIPGMAMVRARAKRLNCASNLKQVGALAMQFSADRDGQLPLYKAAAAYNVRDSKNVEKYYRKSSQSRFEPAKAASTAISASGDNRKYWTVGLLRYAKYDMSVFFCPSDERAIELFKASDNRSSYSLNYGADRPGGEEGGSFVNLSSVTRSPAGVVYFGETDLGNLGMKSTDAFGLFFNNNKKLTRKPHGSDYNTGFLDGHVDSQRVSDLNDLYNKSGYKIK